MEIQQQFYCKRSCKNIDTSKMWIDIIKTWGEKNEFGVWDFVKNKIELFPRKKETDISFEYASTEDKKVYYTENSA